MKHFEENSIYSKKHSTGIGYDEISENIYLLVTRKNEKTIWYKLISKVTCWYGRDYKDQSTKESLLNEFINEPERRSKLNVNIDDEHFYAKKQLVGAGGWTRDIEYYFNIKYVDEIK